MNRTSHVQRELTGNYVQQNFAYPTPLDKGKYSRPFEENLNIHTYEDKTFS